LQVAPDLLAESASVVRLLANGHGDHAQVDLVLGLVVFVLVLELFAWLAGRRARRGLHPKLKLIKIETLDNHKNTETLSSQLA
jgi:hypothetical protein